MIIYEKVSYTLRYAEITEDEDDMVWHLLVGMVFTHYEDAAKMVDSLNKSLMSYKHEVVKETVIGEVA